MSSLADQARTAELTELSLTDPVAESNTDLFRDILNTPAQTFVVATDKTSANQYWDFLGSLRP